MNIPWPVIKELNNLLTGEVYNVWWSSSKLEYQIQHDGILYEFMFDMPTGLFTFRWKASL